MSVYTEFETILGAEGVITESAALGEAETATFGIGHRIPAILRPATREEVQACVRVANRCGVTLYPVSGGKNWGYGSRVPAADGTALLDLSRMNRILDYSQDHGYVTVEPGVTQRQLFDFLEQQGSKFWLDCTGASPECSVIGNTVERGFGHTPYGDHFNNIANLEVVLPTGETIETGYGRFGNIAATPTYRWGVGPILDGLFSQSNFGIVTRLTMWLMPRPEYFQAFFFSAEGEQSIGPIVDALRPLRLDGTLRSASHIGNDYKVLSGIQQYPWTRTGEATPLTRDAIRQIGKELHFGQWNGSGGLYGTRRQVAEARRLVKRALKSTVQRFRVLDDRTLELAGHFAGPAKWLTGWDLRGTLDLVRPVFGLMKGIPTDQPLKSVYWRKRTPPPAAMDPDRDKCGLLWCAPVAPTLGTHAQKIAALASGLLLHHGFEPLLSVTLLTERTLTCVVSISYDRCVPGEDERAMAAHLELLVKLMENGYHFYRLGIQSMHVAQADNGYAFLINNLKRTLDPNGILAPGRYQMPGVKSRSASAQQS